MLVALRSDRGAGWRRVLVDHALIPRPESLVMDDYLGDVHRGSGETSTRSINLLTGRGWTQAGAIEGDTPGRKRWTPLKSEVRVCIGDIGNGFSFSADLVRDDQKEAGSTL